MKKYTLKIEDEIKEKILLKHCQSWYVTNETTKKKIFLAMQEWAEEYHRQCSKSLISSSFNLCRKCGNIKLLVNDC